MKRLLRVLPMLAIVPLTACDVLGPGSEEGLSLSFAVQHASTAGSASVLAADPVTVNGHTLDVQSAEVLFQYIQLERASAAQGEDGDENTSSDFTSDDSDEAMLHNVTVALPLNGGVVTAATEGLPVGFYSEVEMEIATVRVTGTFDGQPFDVVLPVAEGFEVDITPALEIKDAKEALNITLNVNVNSWFTTSSGLVDPRIAGDSNNRMATRGRVARSFLAINDEDRDGN